MGYFTSNNTLAFVRFSLSYFVFVNSAEGQVARLLLKRSQPENKGYLKLPHSDASCSYQETFVYERLSTSLELNLSSIQSSLVRNNQLDKLSSSSSTCTRQIPCFMRFTRTNSKADIGIYFMST